MRITMIGSGYVGLVSGACLSDFGHDVVGRGHAERLVPMIAALPDGGRAERILVDCGPGSFTGIRVVAHEMAFHLIQQTLLLL